MLSFAVQVIKVKCSVASELSSQWESVATTWDFSIVSGEKKPERERKRRGRME